VKDLAALFSVPFAVDDAVTVAGAAAGRVYEHAFALHDGREIVIAWSKDVPRMVDIHLRLKRRSAIEHHFDGSTDRYRPFDGRTLSHVQLAPGHARTFEIVP
jgi:hypothetical protein